MQRIFYSYKESIGAVFTRPDRADLQSVHAKYILRDFKKITFINIRNGHGKNFRAIVVHIGAIRFQICANILTD